MTALSVASQRDGSHRSSLGHKMKFHRRLRSQPELGGNLGIFRVVAILVAMVVNATTVILGASGWRPVNLVGVNL